MSAHQWKRGPWALAAAILAFGSLYMALPAHLGIAQNKEVVDPQATEESPPEPEEKPLPDSGAPNDLGSYKAGNDLDGRITAKCSDAMANMMTFWAEGFKGFYPNVQFSVEKEGSGPAPTALIRGTADICPVAREFREKEITDFQAKFGYAPSRVVVAVDALAVFVHKDNRVEELSLAQVDAIFGQNRKRGQTEDITKWGQLGLTGEWENANISLYGRNSTSGTYAYFKEIALRKGDLKTTVVEQGGSAKVVKRVEENRHAIGYSGVGYKTDGVRAVPLSEGAGGKAFEATNENCYSGDYPLSRHMYIYFNRAEGKPTDPKIREFFRYVHSKEGQEHVVKDGYTPLTKPVANTCAKAYE